MGYYKHQNLKLWIFFLVGEDHQTPTPFGPPPSVTFLAETLELLGTVKLQSGNLVLFAVPKLSHLLFYFI